MTHDHDFEHELRLLFETPAPPGTDRGAMRRLSGKVRWRDIFRRALQAAAYAACAGAAAWWVCPGMAGAIGLSSASALCLAALAGAALCGALQRV